MDKKLSPSFSTIFQKKEGLFMEVFQTVINYVLNLGSAIFVPLIILILGLLAGMKFKKAFMSALTLGSLLAGCLWSLAICLTQ